MCMVTDTGVFVGGVAAMVEHIGTHNQSCCSYLSWQMDDKMNFRMKLLLESTLLVSPANSQWGLILLIGINRNFLT
jgi:hypothetical protein